RDRARRRGTAMRTIASRVDAGGRRRRQDPHAAPSSPPNHAENRGHCACIRRATMVAAVSRPLAPRLVLDAHAPRMRVRVWEADAREVTAHRPAAHPGVELAWVGEGAIAYGIGRAHFELTPARA